MDGLKKDRLGLFNKGAKASLGQTEPQAYLGFVVYLFSTFFFLKHSDKKTDFHRVLKSIYKKLLQNSNIIKTLKLPLLKTAKLLLV